MYRKLAHGTFSYKLRPTETWLHSKHSYYANNWLCEGNIPPRHDKHLFAKPKQNKHGQNKSKSACLKERKENSNNRWGTPPMHTRGSHASMVRLQMDKRFGADRNELGEQKMGWGRSRTPVCCFGFAFWQSLAGVSLPLFSSLNYSDFQLSFTPNDPSESPALSPFWPLSYCRENKAKQSMFLTPNC